MEGAGCHKEVTTKKKCGGGGGAPQHGPGGVGSSWIRV